ncbi:MAG: hypothetical protein WDM76_02020 [Limisphaerales bacterium]
MLCVSAQNIPRADAAENAAWRDWTGVRLAPKKILGEAFVASAAWQCVAACGAIQKNKFIAANVSIVGANQQAIGARFAKQDKSINTAIAMRYSTDTFQKYWKWLRSPADCLEIYSGILS